MQIQTGLKMVEFSDNLDLSSFYTEAKNRGYDNNSSQRNMIDCFKREKVWNAWIVYKNNEPCGSVACHTLNIMGENSYRICARTCFFTEYGPYTGVQTRNKIRTHQHVTSQLFIPVMIKWLGLDKELYITTNNSTIASQRMVHTIWAPEMFKMGLLSKVADIDYRGHVQTFWKLNSELFLADLEKYPTWI